MSFGRGGALDRRRRSQAALLIIPVVFILLMFVLPLGRLLWISVWDEANGITFVHYVEILTSRSYIWSFLWTIELAFFTGVLCVIFGYPVAYVIARSGPWLKAALITGIMLPLWTSSLVRAFSMIEVLGRTGVVNSLLVGSGVVDAPIALLFNRPAVYIGTVHVMLPYMVLTIYGAMLRVDASLVTAAETLGASRLRAFFLVYVPQTLTGVTSGFILVFTISLGFYITPAVLGGSGVQPFIVLVERSMNASLNWPLAAALSAILLIVTLLLYAVFGRHLGLGVQQELHRSGAVTAFRLLSVTDRVFRPVRRVLRWRSKSPRRARVRWSTAHVLALVIAAALAFPILLIVLMAFSTSYAFTFPPERLSLQWFHLYFSRPEWLSATLNSFQIAFLTAGSASVMAVLVALGLKGLPERRRVFVLGLFITPIIVPHMVYGVAAYFHLVSFGLIGSKISFVLAHTVLAIAPALLLVFAAVMGLDDRLEDAAASLGATSWQRFRHITLPLIAPAVGACALVAFLTSFEDLSVALFLGSGEMVTLPWKMYDSIRVERDPRVTAASAFVVGISLVGLALSLLLRGRGATLAKA